MKAVWTAYSHAFYAVDASRSSGFAALSDGKNWRFSIRIADHENLHDRGHCGVLTCGIVGEGR